jgi:hypothetical protein
MIEMMVLPFMLHLKKLKEIFRNKDTYFIILSILFLTFLFVQKPTDYTYVKLFTAFAFMPYIYLVCKYTLFKESMFGLGLAITGFYLNNLCVKLNGIMPVIPIWQRDMVEKTNTATHFITTYSGCKVWFLADIIDVYYNVYSIGDLLIFAVFFLVIMGFFKKVIRNE